MPMNIFRLRSDTEQYRFLELVDPAGWQAVNDMLNGIRPLSNWQSLEVRMSPPSDQVQQDLPVSDFPGLGGLDVFSRRCADQFQSLLQGRGHFLPLECAEQQYIGFYTTFQVDALDEVNSKFWQLESGRLVDIVEHKFRIGSLDDAVIFRLPQKPFGPTYVTDIFVEQVKVHNFMGFRFEPVGSA